MKWKSVALARALVVACAVVLMGVGRPALADDPAIVRIDGGLVAGASEGGALVFRGIPFAAPPVGPLRWRPPQPAAAWRGVRQAVIYGPDCPQVPMSNIPGPGFTGPSGEDCLYLNVWAPAAHPAKPAPVMVWIYGGAFIMGAGSYPDYDGAHFAEKGVVLVTFNYRIGLFGFFAHPALTAETPEGPLGNYGFMDQIAALQWVQRNIAAFGGDPTNVTIFGESAGGEAVNAMLVSPIAHGLFAKAITESGGGRSLPGSLSWPQLRGGPASAEARGKAWAVSVGVGGDDPAALRALPAEVVLKGSFGPVLPAPMIDGKVVPERIEAAMADGHHAVVPFLVGSNSEEESLVQWLPNAPDDLLGKLGPQGEAALQLYEADGLGRRAAAARLWGEAFMVAPARFVARGMAADEARTWLYHYAYIPKGQRGLTPGAPHSAEINLVFGNIDRVSMFGETSADRPMSQLIQDYWIAFARTGDPNGEGRPLWPAYTAGEDDLLEFTNDGAVEVKNFGKPRLDLLDHLTEPAPH